MKDTFRFNKKRKHYAYIFKIKNGYCLNILLTTQSKSIHKKHGKTKVVNNIKVYKHPNSKISNVVIYIYNHSPYVDSLESFSRKELDWIWDINDKRNVKRMKKYKKNKDYFQNK